MNGSQDKRESTEEDDEEGGDLGLGEGICPGNFSSESTDDKATVSSFVVSLASTSSDSGGQVQTSPQKSKLSERLPHFFSREKTDQQQKILTVTADGDQEEVFPKFGDVPMGTSLKQHKQLFQQSLKEIYSKNSSMNYITGRKQKNSQEEEPVKDIMDKKLTIAIEEVDQLKQELENCQRKLEAKQEAIKILQRQVEQDQGDNKATERKSKDLYQNLEKEMSRVEYELACQHSKFVASEQEWAYKLNRICQENSCLLACLDRKAEEIRKLQAEKMGLSRQRDELLALMDVKERSKYESIHGQAQEKYNDYSTDELSVLGACHCRVSNPEPCGCAHAAANLKKELVRLKEEVDTHKQRRDEAYNTVDAYRVAFEEQLNRNKLLTNQITELATMPPQQQKIKVKNVIKWIAGQLTEDNLPPPSTMVPQEQPPQTNITISGKGVNINCSSEQDLIQSLLDMLNDKSNALAHQKLAAQMLACKTQELEKQLKETNMSPSSNSPAVVTDIPSNTISEGDTNMEYSQNLVTSTGEQCVQSQGIGKNSSTSTEEIVQDTEKEKTCTDDVLDYETCL